MMTAAIIFANALIQFDLDKIRSNPVPMKKSQVSDNREGVTLSLACRLRRLLSLHPVRAKVECTGFQDIGCRDWSWCLQRVGVPLPLSVGTRVETTSGDHQPHLVSRKVDQ